MNEIVVHPNYSHLRGYILSLPDTFGSEGRVIQDHRNVIKDITHNNQRMVIKRFSGMYLVNRITYSLFRPSKAKRSYYHSLELNKCGINTPPPIGYLDIYSAGLLVDSFFLSQHQDYKTLEQTLNEVDYNLEKSLPVLKAVGALAYKLHQNNIYHDDFSVGNILVMPVGAGFDFSLVDLNRILFKKINYRLAIKNFNKLKLTAELLNEIIREYAALANLDYTSAIKLAHEIREIRSTLRTMRRGLKRNTLTPLMKFFGKKR